MKEKGKLILFELHQPVFPCITRNPNGTIFYNNQGLVKGIGYNYYDILIYSNKYLTHDVLPCNCVNKNHDTVYYIVNTSAANFWNRIISGMFNIDTAFIEHYIEQFNKGNIIGDVMVDKDKDDSILHIVSEIGNQIEDTFKDFVKPDNMLKLGFELLKSSEDYITYQNNGTILYNPSYNKDFPEPKGKVIISVSLAYYKDKVFITIEQDGGTRKSYHGECNSEEFLLLLLYNIR